MMKILGIIPSRYGSSRFPGKPLADINGKSMIQRVYGQSVKSGSLSDVIVATDDRHIYDHVEQFGGKVMMTSAAHSNGTERCGEVAEKVSGSYDVVINIQGDEPFINPHQIDQLAACFSDGYQGIATLVKKIEDREHIDNPHLIKVVFNTNHEALYFSRSPIPYLRNPENHDAQFYYKHIGIYGYHVDALRQIIRLKPSVLETYESLEQLRWLENGYTIRVAETEYESASIDTPEDLERILHLNL